LALIRNAYSKLARFLNILMRDYQPDFNSQRIAKLIDFEYEQGLPRKSVLEIPSYRKIDEVFAIGQYKPNDIMKNYTQQCTQSNPDKYLSIKNDVNDIIKPNWDKLQIYYFLMDDKIYFLPEPEDNNFYIQAELLYLPDVISFNWDTEIPMTQEYLDMLIKIAAMEGMQDIARIDKVQIYSSEIYEEFKILGQYASLMKEQEGVK